MALLGLVLLRAFEALQVAAASYTLYQMAVSLAGLPRRAVAVEHEPSKTFAFVVPAHNEARVIAPLVQSLLAQKYPRHLYRIIVAADHCTDDTAAVARAAGAEVYVRDDGPGGKNHVLADVFDWLLRSAERPDAVAVVDADNLVHPLFLRRMNESLLAGKKIVQGYLGTKNPDDTWVSRMYYLSYVITNRSWQIARQNLGLANALGGTGMVITTDVIERFGWHPQSLTEDLEFTVQAYLEAGIRAAWNHDAIIYDEKPLSLGASLRQRERWMRGHTEVMTQYVVRLLWQAVRRLDFTAFDMAMFLVMPSRMVVTGLSLFMAIARTGWHAAVAAVLPVGVWWSFVAFQVCYPLLFLVLERVPVRRAAALLAMPLWAWTWVPLAVSGLVRRRNHTWNHTTHTRSVGIEAVAGELGAGGQRT